MEELISLQPLLFVLLLLLAFRTARYVASTRRPRGFPPGPPTLLGLGNLHQLPLNKAFTTFGEWAEQYGTMLGLKLGNKNMVVLHRAHEVYEMLQNHGAVYAGRPRMAILCDYVHGDGWDHSIGFMSDQFRRLHHRACKHHLGPRGIADIAPTRRAMAVELLGKLSRLTEHDVAASVFEQLLFNWHLGTTLTLVCGQSADDFGEAWTDNYHAVQKGTVELAEPGGVTPPLDIFPLLACVPRPLAKWKQTAAVLRRKTYDMYNALLAQAQRARRDAQQPGRYEPLMVKLLRERDHAAGARDAARFSDRDILLIGGGILDAASHTTQSTSMFLVQAPAAHPDKQRRARAEIDAVFGAAVPRDIDPARFPYLNACITEVLRWRPGLPLGLPRESLQDDVVMRGYRIPKGTTVLINTWAIHHDADFYDAPDQFRPERFLDNRLGGKATRGAGDDDMAWRKPLYTFGAGRRACQGEQMALDGLCLLFAVLLWGYEVVPDGELDLSLETGIQEGLVVSPKKFRVRFVPRREQRAWEETIASEGL